MGHLRPTPREKTEANPSCNATTTDKDGTSTIKNRPSKLDRVRGKRRTELDPPASRNGGPEAVEFHLLSHNSTVKMEIVSSNADGRSELP